MFYETSGENSQTNEVFYEPLKNVYFLKTLN